MRLAVELPGEAITAFLDLACETLRETLGVAARLDLPRPITGEQIGVTIAAKGDLEGVTWRFPVAIAKRAVEVMTPGLPYDRSLGGFAIEELANVLTGRSLVAFDDHSLVVEIAPPQQISTATSRATATITTELGSICVELHQPCIEAEISMSARPTMDLDSEIAKVLAETPPQELFGADAPPRRTPTLPPDFPGATLAIDAEGSIVSAWMGPDSPVTAPTGDVFAALGVDDSHADAARVQLLLSAAVGASAEAWTTLAADAPAMMIRRDGRPLALFWQPSVVAGRIEAVTVFAIAGEPPRIEAVDAAEINRICVEALALLDECDGCVRHLLQDPHARHAVHQLFRAIHTIKGATRGTQLRDISDLAHSLEERLELVRNDNEVQIEALTEISSELSRLRTQVRESRPRGEIDDAMTELIAESRTALGDLRTAIQTADFPLATRSVATIFNATERASLRGLRMQCIAAQNALEMLAERPDPDLVLEVAALAAHLELYIAVHREVSASDAGPSLLVTLSSWLDAPEDRAGTFDSLVPVMASAGVPSLVEALTSEDPFAMRRALALISDAPAMFEPARPRDDASLRFERAQRDLLAAIDGLARHAPETPLTDIRAIVQRLVWTPLSTFGRRLVRMTRTLGAELGKNLAAEVDLGDVLVAPEIGRIIGEILVHATRNAADHGIEPPGEREAAGKNPAGTIRVTAIPVGDRVRLIVRDDGRGISVEKVRATGVRRGLIAPDAELTDHEVLDLLFSPGFSTTTSVTAVSGRGVGMDVIKSLAEAYGGSVVLASRGGTGTELLVELPLAPSA